MVIVRGEFRLLVDGASLNAALTQSGHSSVRGREGNTNSHDDDV